MSKKRVLLIRNVAPEMFGGGETYQIKLGLVFMMLLLVLMGASYASDDNQTDGH